MTLIFAKPVTWDKSKSYLKDNIVFVGRAAYTALQNVPSNVEITNTTYWKETGVPNSSDISNLESDVSSLKTTVGNQNSGLVKDVADNTSDIDDLESDMDNVKFTLYTPTS